MEYESGMINGDWSQDRVNQQKCVSVLPSCDETHWPRGMCNGQGLSTKSTDGNRLSEENHWNHEYVSHVDVQKMFGLDRDDVQQPHNRDTVLESDVAPCPSEEVELCLPTWVQD